jgi:hypothetical protein
MLLCSWLDPCGVPEILRDYHFLTLFDLTRSILVQSPSEIIRERCRLTRHSLAQGLHKVENKGRMVVELEAVIGCLGAESLLVLRA